MKTTNFNCNELSNEELQNLNGGLIQEIVDICISAYIYYKAHKGSVLNYNG